MNFSLFALLWTLVVFALGVLIALRYIEAQGRHANALAKVDLVSYALGFTGTLTLVPEILHAFSPELTPGDAFVGSMLARLDYLGYLLVPLSFGLGVARRVISVRATKKVL